MSLVVTSHDTLPTTVGETYEAAVYESESHKRLGIRLTHCKFTCLLHVWNDEQGFHIRREKELGGIESIKQRMMELAPDLTITTEYRYEGSFDGEPSRVYDGQSLELELLNWMEPYVQHDQ